MVRKDSKGRLYDGSVPFSQAALHIDKHGRVWEVDDYGKPTVMISDPRANDERKEYERLKAKYEKGG